MFYLFTGTDRKAAREALNALADKLGKKRRRVVVSDAHTLEDLHAALSSGGMFSEPRIVVLDSVLTNLEMRQFALGSLPSMAGSDDIFCMIEEKPDAATRKLLEKHAEESEKFDAAKREEGSNIFAIGNALRRSDRKAAWIALQRELIAGKAPEAIHGILFWAAKDMTLKARSATELSKARSFVVALAELPHEARRQGFELDCALERFVLSLS